ncbi:IgGFc-binding protein [Nannocystis bainbridge]|uniref:IgGFc-binding protein n=1 Tax=Nannocystis bainbridge TaxID=2995303 RepID=A0ABT5DYU4_9BACT|nr:IgGFc-binding protein [Nannocystis bainbridge]MDC0718778.1 IgGFc-binding protein [Nannocystis bainbridge]
MTATEATAGTATDAPTGTDSASGASEGSGTDSATVGTTATPPTTTDPTTTDGVTTDAVTSTDTASTTGEPCEPVQCSPDLKGLECDGQIVSTCEDDSYCVDGVCTPLAPCEAAALLQGSEGCEFWAVKTQTTKSGGCFAAFVANTWDEPVHIEVEYDGQSLDVAGFTRIPQGQGEGISYAPYDPGAGLPVGQVALVFLSRGTGDNPDCPAPAGVAAETEVVGTGRGKGFRITTDRPVAAYQMLPYGGGSVAITSATLMLPTSVWDTNYVVVNAYAQSVAVPAARPLWAIVAGEDGTEVTLDPKVAVVGGPDVAAGAAGVPIQYTLDRGETIQFAQSAELTGSPLVANKPVGVFGGASCFNVPVGASYCDGAHQQIPPIKALGSAYVAVRYKNRLAMGVEETPPWRLVGTVDGTMLTWEPGKPAGAPDTLSLGQVAEFAAAGPFTVRSQDSEHPFYFAGYMTGGQLHDNRGDPEWVNVIPSEQYLDRYVFFTDPTYSETSLVVVRRKQDGAYADVTLGCAGVLDGWAAVDDEHEYTRVDLVTGNFEDVGGCSNGRHEISSANPIGVTVWGWGSPESVDFYTLNVSYAYPAGAAIRPINDVTIMPQ